MPSCEVDALVAPVGYPPTEANFYEFDAIVVHGGNLTPEGKLADRNFARLNTAIILYHRGLARRIIMTGGRQLLADESIPANISEAKLMKDYAVANQVPEDAIFIEDKSRDIITNAMNVKREYLRPNGWFEIIDVMDKSHRRRCKRILKDTLGEEYIVQSKAPPERFSTIKRMRTMWGMLTRLYIFDGIEKGDDEAIERRLKECMPGHDNDITLKQFRKDCVRHFLARALLARSLRLAIAK